MPNRIKSLMLSGLLCTLGQHALSGPENTPPADASQNSTPFNVKLVLTNDEAKVRSDWKKPTPPQITVIDKAHKGETISTLIFFSGCEVSAEKTCNLIADYKLRTPDKNMIDGGSGKLWTTAPLEAQFMLGNSSAAVPIGEDWPNGEYAFEVIVIDHVAAKSVKMTAPFVVID